MTKAELVAAIEAKFTTVGSATLAVLSAADQAEFDAANIALYRIPVWERAGERGVRRQIYFHVFDKGGGGEDAYYQDRDPDTHLVPEATKQVWRTAVEAAIAAKRAAAQIHQGIITEHYEEEKVSVVRVLLDSGAGPDVTFVDYAAWENTSEALEFEELV